MPSKAGSTPNLARRRACQRCFDHKLRCEPQAGGCPRCVKRGVRCIYLGLEPPQQNVSSTADSLPTPQDSSLFNFDSPSTSSGVGQNAAGTGSVDWTPRAAPPPQSLSSPTTAKSTNVDDLVCTVDVNEIRNRWLSAFLPSSEQIPKTYPASITAYMSRMLKAYCQMVIQRSKFPPFVHKLQVSGHMRTGPLINCLSIAKLCSAPVEGNEAFAQDTIQRELDKLYRDHTTYNEIELLGAYQAYLIYCMMIFFHLSVQDTTQLRQLMINLQDIACEVCTRGLISVSELNQVRPGYDVWVVVEAKRRTLYTMYLFDSVLCAHDTLPVYLGTELRGLPAPASEELWETTEVDKWNAAYNAFLHTFADGGLRIDELWRMPTEWSEHQVQERRRRVDKWLASIDKFGTMLYAVTICTHGG